MDNQTRIDGLLTLLWNWELGTALLQGAAGTSTGMRRGGSADRARRGAARAQGRRSRGGAGAAGRPGTSEVGTGRRPGQSVEAAAEDEAPARRGMRGRPRGSGAAGAGIASGPPGTRRRRSVRGDARTMRRPAPRGRRKTRRAAELAGRGPSGTNARPGMAVAAAQAGERGSRGTPGRRRSEIGEVSERRKGYSWARL